MVNLLSNLGAKLSIYIFSSKRNDKKLTKNEQIIVYLSNFTYQKHYFTEYLWSAYQNRPLKETLT